MARRAIDVKDIDGRAKKLRETNAKEKGEKIGGNACAGKLNEAYSGDNDIDAFTDASINADVAGDAVDVLLPDKQPQSLHPDDDGAFFFYPRDNPRVADFPADIDDVGLTEKEQTIPPF